jgi:CBS domain-containing protein
LLIGDLAAQDSRQLFTINAESSVEDAINLMAEKETTGLIVVEKDRPVGIFTERDVLLSYVKFGRKPFKEVTLREAMTNKLIVAKPDDSVDATISMMTNMDIRHLPVVEKGKIIAFLYICDLVQHQVGALASELHYLEEYLEDLQQAGQD